VTPTVAFFNNKGGVGKTTLTYNLAWMLREQGWRVLAVDLDPQANLTSAFLDDRAVEDLWGGGYRRTIYGALAPLFEGEGGLGQPHVVEIENGLHLIAGDLMLSSAEQELSGAWPLAGDGNKRALRVLSSFATVMQRAVEATNAQVVLVDVGPNLGALNRPVMVGCDHVIVPLSPDLFSLQGLRNLGPTLRSWRSEWVTRRSVEAARDLDLPSGDMQPRGYVVLQHGVRRDRVVGAYDRWLRQVPAEFRVSVLGEPGEGVEVPTVGDDPWCLGLLKHFHSLIPLAQEARKPVFLLRSADGAIGAHQQAVQAAYQDFVILARRVANAVGLPPSPRSS
jgi:chromosome partitioning protein